jgi:hypothetical protein
VHDLHGCGGEVAHQAVVVRGEQRAAAHARRQRVRHLRKSILQPNGVSVSALTKRFVVPARTPSAGFGYKPIAELIDQLNR